MVERGGLENRCARKRTEGSNPSLSASSPQKTILCFPFIIAKKASDCAVFG